MSISTRSSRVNWIGSGDDAGVVAEIVPVA